MLNKAVFNTDTHEIRIENNGRAGWLLRIYEVKHGVKEISEEHLLQYYSTAYMYIEEYFFKREQPV